MTKCIGLDNKKQKNKDNNDTNEKQRQVHRIKPQEIYVNGF